MVNFVQKMARMAKLRGKMDDLAKLVKFVKKMARMAKRVNVERKWMTLQNWQILWKRW